MAWQKIQIRCPKCNGSGIVSPSALGEEIPIEKECSFCEGKKFMPWGRLKVESEE